jgi:hypothetical protein
MWLMPHHPRDGLHPDVFRVEGRCECPSSGVGRGAYSRCLIGLPLTAQGRPIFKCTARSRRTQVQETLRRRDAALTQGKQTDWSIIRG